MKQLFLITLTAGIAVPLSFLLASHYYHYSPLHKRITHATAVIHPTQGNEVNGIVRFEQEQNGVRITAHLNNLTPGEHGFHIHEMGDCGCPDAKCAGEHYNPFHKPHAGLETDERHVGDFGNIIADAQGYAEYNELNTLVELNGPYSIIGRTVIVHAKPDDLHTQPSGNSGDRIGCGVIGIAQG